MFAVRHNPGGPFELISVAVISHQISFLPSFIFYLFTDFIYLFLEKERERTINVWLPLPRPLLGTWPTTQAHALDWELYQRPFGLQTCAQSTEPHQPGLMRFS